MDKAVLGKRVRDLRQRRGWTLRDLEAAAGVSYQYVSALETGAPNANVTLDTLSKILTPLGATLEIVSGRPEELQHLEQAVARLTPEQARRLTRIAEALPQLRERTADVLTAAFEDAAVDVRA